MNRKLIIKAVIYIFAPAPAARGFPPEPLLSKIHFSGGQLNLIWGLKFGMEGFHLQYIHTKRDVNTKTKVYLFHLKK